MIYISETEVEHLASAALGLDELQDVGDGIGYYTLIEILKLVGVTEFHLTEEAEQGVFAYFERNAKYFRRVVQRKLEELSEGD